jgi:hypothetical protein
MAVWGAAARLFGLFGEGSGCYVGVGCGLLNINAGMSAMPTAAATAGAMSGRRSGRAKEVFPAATTTKTKHTNDAYKQHEY